MLNNLGNYISSFGSNTRKNINSVLKKSSLEKEELGRMIAGLSSFTSAADYIPVFVSPLSILQREALIDLFRDTELRVKSLYSVSSTLSVLSSSMENIFGGELKKLENDIAYLSGYINNYSFISGEEDLYNVNFVENFDNDQNSYQYDLQTISSIPDRNNITFLNSEKSYVDSFTGSLKFSSNKEENIITIEDSNIESISFDSNFAQQFISSDTGIRNVISGNSNNSWNITVKSPSIINESIFSQDKYKSYINTLQGSGIEVAVKVVLKSAVNASRIRIAPNIGEGLYVTQLIVQGTESNTNNSNSQENNYVGIISDSIYSEKNIDIDFPPQNVKSFIIFFKQKKYNRIKIPAQQSEVNAKLVNHLVKKMRLERKKNHDILQDYVIDFFLKDYSRDLVLKNKEIYSYNYMKYYPIINKTSQMSILGIEKTTQALEDVDNYNRFKNSDLINSMVFSLVAFSLGSKMRSLNPGVYIESNLRSTIKGIDSYSSGGIIPVGDSNMSENNAHFVNETNSPFTKNDAIQAMNNVQETNLYEYMLSIRNISLMSVTNAASNLNSKRSYYVSKRLPLDNRPMYVKCLTERLNTTASRSSLDLPDPTSIEVSVSVVDSPSLEQHWKPILPYNLTNVPSELLVFNTSTRTALFRFAPLQESVILYKNGTQIPSTDFNVSGMSVTVTPFDQQAVYVAKYTPLNLKTSKEINLYSGNLASPTLVSSSTMGQSGEYFSTVNYDLSVQLSSNPYIDRVKFQNAQYNIYTGTVTSANTSFGNFDYSNYSPVKVMFDDGSTAINITNYLLNDNQVPSFPQDSNEFYFVHYDKTIIFNKKPTQSFRVLYNYIQDSFRYRVVFRSLNQTSENYSLDRIIFKFSCEKENVIENKFIRYDNIFKPRLV